jgi:hypothetical protein
MVIIRGDLEDVRDLIGTRTHQISQMLLDTRHDPIRDVSYRQGYVLSTPTKSDDGASFVRAFSTSHPILGLIHALWLLGLHRKDGFNSGRPKLEGGIGWSRW